MKVAVLQQFLRNLIAPMREAGANEKKTSDLEHICQALESFKGDEIDQLAAFLAQAEEFRRTKLLPMLKSKARSAGSGAAKALNQEQIQYLTEQIRQLDERAAGGVTPRAELAPELDRLGLDNLTKPEAAALAKGLDIQVPLRTSAAKAVQLVRRLVLEGREALTRPSGKKQAVDQAKVQHLAQRVRQLEERAADADSSTDVLNAELDRLGLEQLNKPEALAVAKELGEQVNARTTQQQAVHLIRRTVLDRKEALETAKT